MMHENIFLFLMNYKGKKEYLHPNQVHFECLSHDASNKLPGAGGGALIRGLAPIREGRLFQKRIFTKRLKVVFR